MTLRFIEKYLSEVVEWKFEPDPNVPERLEAENLSPDSTWEPKTAEPAKYEAAIVALEQSMVLNRYSHKTVKAYKNCLRNFIKSYDETRPREITRKQIEEYLVKQISEKSISVSHQNQILSAIKYFYINVAEQEEKVAKLFYPKKPQKLPQVLTENEIVRLLKAIDNLKHRCIIMLIYSAGLRLGEVVRLKLTDIQPDQNRVFVRAGKGQKDRCTILASKTWEILKGYLELYHLKGSQVENTLSGASNKFFGMQNRLQI